MLYLFYGDAYLAQEKIRGLIPATSKPVSIDEKKQLEEYLPLLDNQNLFNNNPPLILYGLFKTIALFEKIAQRLLKWGSQKYSLLILIEDAKPDLRLNLTKAIQKTGQVIELKPLNKPQLRTFLQKKWAGLEPGIQLEQKIIETLIDLHGPNLFLLENELNKLSLAFGKKQIDIDIEDVTRLSRSSKELAVFDLIDSFASKDLKKTVDLTLQSYEQNLDPWYLFNLITRQVRLLLEIKSGGSIGQPFFIIDKLKSQQKNWSIQELKNALQCLLETEVKIKEGKGELENELLIFFNMPT